MVFILHRYIFKELLKVFILSTIGLGAIMSLGSILRPVQEYGVGPEQVLSLLGYFLPITLTFVLPVAALFATSLVYGRFASDNEFDACKASGISPAMLIYPGLILAVVVAIANLVLSFHVVPVYVHRAERAIKADAKQILFRNIHRQGYYNLPGGKFTIYADAADAKNSSLLGVVIMDTKSGRNKIVTAESATVNFDSQSGRFSEVKVFVKNAFQFGDDGSAFSYAAELTGPFETMMQDNVKFQKIEQINAIKASPISYYPIALSAWNAYEQMTIELLAEEITKSIASAKNKFFELYSKDRRLKITGKSCSLLPAQNVIEIAGDVNLFEYDKNSGNLTRSYHGERLTLQLSDTEKRPVNTLFLTFPNAVWFEKGIDYIKPRLTVQDISLPESVAVKLGENIIATVDEHKYVPLPSKRLEALTKEMNRKIRITLAEIKAEIHSRLVFGIGCITLIIIGIGLGIRFRGGHLLTAFGVSSIPAAALLVFIMMGKNITKSRSTDLKADVGIALMWLGLLGLTAFAFMLYRKLLRN